MENGQNANAIGTQGGITVKHVELNEHSMSSVDVMNRRLKNRERQRRYRLRKKMEADSKKDFVSDQPTRPKEDVELSGNHYNYINRVHCERNWKKDARRAHTCKKLQEAPVVATIPASALKTEIQKPSLVPQLTVEAQMERENNQVEGAFSFSGSETKAKHSKRDWKAEARRKKI